MEGVRENDSRTGRALTPPFSGTPWRLARRISFARRSCHGASPPGPATTLAACLHTTGRYAPRLQQWSTTTGSLVGMAEGGQHQTPEAGNRNVVNARSGLIAQIANSRRVVAVSDCVQRCTRQVKMHRVIGLVEENDRISFPVRENDLTGSQIAQRRLLVVPPIFVTGKSRSSKLTRKASSC